MKLRALVEAFIARREPGGLLVAPGQIHNAAIAAVRLFLGHADLAAGPVPDTALEAAVLSVDLTAGEWALIGPLFELYVEREAAVIVEGSRSAGIEAMGRSASEVAADIERAHETLPMLAFSLALCTVGMELPDGA